MIDLIIQVRLATQRYESDKALRKESGCDRLYGSPQEAEIVSMNDMYYKEHSNIVAKITVYIAS